MSLDISLFDPLPSLHVRQRHSLWHFGQKPCLRSYYSTRVCTICCIEHVHDLELHGMIFCVWAAGMLHKIAADAAVLHLLHFLMYMLWCCLCRHNVLQLLLLLQGHV